MSYDCLDKSTCPPPKSGKWLLTPQYALVPYDPKKIIFNEIKQMSYGGGQVLLTYGSEALRLQTPPMMLPFGVTTYNNKRGKSIVMELSFREASSMPALQDFYDTVRAMDRLTMEALVKNRKTWMPWLRTNKCRDHEMWKFYCAATRMRESKGGQEYPPRLTVKVWPNQSLMFGKRTQKKGEKEKTIGISGEALPRGTWVTASIRCTGLWIGKDSAALAFVLEQGRIVDPPTGVSPDGPPVEAVCLMPDIDVDMN